MNGRAIDRFFLFYFAAVIIALSLVALARPGPPPIPSEGPPPIPTVKQSLTVPAPAVAGLPFQDDHRCRICSNIVLAKSGPGPVAGSHVHRCPWDGRAFWHMDAPMFDLKVNQSPAVRRWRR